MITGGVLFYSSNWVMNSAVGTHTTGMVNAGSPQEHPNLTREIISVHYTSLLSQTRVGLFSQALYKSEDRGYEDGEEDRKVHPPVDQEGSPR